VNVAIITNVIPSYRRGFYRRLLGRPQPTIRVLCQCRLPGFNLKLIHHEFRDHVTLVPFWGSEKGLVWQQLPVRRLWRDYDAYVFYGNPRVISNVLWATIFRLLGRRVVMQGQAHSAGANRLAERLRLTWWRLFDAILVYTDREAVVLKRRGFASKRVVGLNNGLDQQEIEAAKADWPEERLSMWQAEQGLGDRPILLSVARLVPEKGFDFVLSALPALVRQFPGLLWSVVGDGNARADLEARAKELGLSEHVRWLGAIYDERALAPWFLSSWALVHASGIGLTLLHAFGYGVPVVVHHNIENHWPEIAAFEDGKNGLTFVEGDADAFCAAVSRLLRDQGLREELGRNALEVAQTRYNADVMVERFLSALDEDRWGCA
jgi:glycosyltransferase involved in cell wall biosynthesis